MHFRTSYRLYVLNGVIVFLLVLSFGLGSGPDLVTSSIDMAPAGTANQKAFGGGEVGKYRDSTTSEAVDRSAWMSHNKKNDEMMASHNLTS